MDPSFWRERWQQGQIGFHNAQVNPELVRWEARFLGSAPHRVLVPLCGKTLDLAWLADRGHDVVGVELSEIAAGAVFEESGRSVAVRDAEGLRVFASPRLTVIQGDLFDVRPAHVGRIDRIWDRAALVALPPERRSHYVTHLRGLAGPDTVVLLNALEYDQALMEGPPFSVPEAEVRAHYEGARVELLDQRDLIAEEPRWAERGHRYWLSTTYLVHLGEP